MAFTHMSYLATEDACMNAYLYKITKSLEFFNKLPGSPRSMQNRLLDIYAKSLNELGLEVTQGTCKNVNDCQIARRLLRQMLNILHEYR